MTSGHCFQNFFSATLPRTSAAQAKFSQRTMGRRRSANVEPPAPQRRNTYELLTHSDHSEDDYLINFEKPTNATSSVPSRWVAFAIGLCTGLAVAMGVYLLLQRYSSAPEGNDRKPEDLQILSKGA